MGSTLRERLKMLRKREDITQEELAAVIGVERSTIGKYEGRQGVIPSAEVLEALADYFNVSVDYLLGRTNDPINYEDGDFIANLRTELLDYFDGDARKAWAVQQATEEDALKETPDVLLLAKNLDLETLLQRSDIHFQLGGRTLSEDEKADVLAFLKFILKIGGGKE